MPEYRIRAVVFKEGDWWVAQCLEYNYVAISRTLEALPEELLRMVTAQIIVSLENGVQPFYGYSPAPRRFWEMFDRACAPVGAIEPVPLPFEGVDLDVRPTIEARLAA